MTWRISRPTESWASSLGTGRSDFIGILLGLYCSSDIKGICSLLESVECSYFAILVPMKFTYLPSFKTRMKGKNFA